jgi:hypothetical protein
MFFRFPPPAESALDAVATALGLDRSATIRFLVLEKARALGLGAVSSFGGSAPEADCRPKPRRRTGGR